MMWWVQRRFHLIVLYDADCAFCALCVRIMRVADLLSIVSYAPRHFGGAEQRIQSIMLGGQMREGMDVIIQVTARSVLLWPLLPLIVVGRLLFAQRAYDFVAARRYQIMGGACKVARRAEGS